MMLPVLLLTFGKSPAEMMESRDGLKKVEQLLIEIQEGYF